MIPVFKQPEPADFDANVRQKGLAFLRRKGIALDQPVPKGAELYPYWRSCLDELHASYQGCCAYLAVFFERETGGASVDHFVAKSASRAEYAYEWRNYRLACSTMNSRKREFDDVLDPFSIQEGWFQVELVSGRIYPNPALPSNTKKQVQETIKRLGLDDAGNRKMRCRHYQDFAEKQYTADFLRKRSPFVYSEALRQGLL